MELKLKSITPIHIGNGEELYELDYLVRDNTYYRISQKKFLLFLSSYKNLIPLYASWIAETSNEMEDLKENAKRAKQKRNTNEERDYNQQLNNIRKSFNLFNFCQRNGKLNEFIEFLRKDKDILKIRGVQPIDKGQVRGNIKDGNNQFYMPGTSIKGAVRTAILFDMIAKDDTNFLENAIQNAIRNSDGSDKSKKHFADKIEHHHFYCGIEDGENRIKWSDEKFDVFKLLSVSDAYAKENDFSVNKVNLYLVQKERTRQGSTTLVSIEQPQSPYIENFAIDNNFSCKLDFNIDFVLSIKDTILTDANDKSYINLNGKKHWIDIKQKLQNVFGLDIEKLTSENKETKKQEILENILQKVAHFSQNQKAADSVWFEKFKNNDSNKTLSKKIESSFNSIQKAENLIHLGYATGFNGITEVLFLKSKDSLRPLLKEYMELFMIGDKPGVQKQRRAGEVYIANIDNFPKSRRMAKINENQISPLGWLQIMNFQQEEVKEEEKKEVVIQYFKGKLKIGAQMTATITKSGTPNRVKVHFSAEHEPELDLMVFRNPIPEEKIGEQVIVEVMQMQKDKITQVKHIKFL